MEWACISPRQKATARVEKKGFQANNTVASYCLCALPHLFLTTAVRSIYIIGRVKKKNQDEHPLDKGGERQKLKLKG